MLTPYLKQPEQWCLNKFPIKTEVENKDHWEKYCYLTWYTFYDYLFLSFFLKYIWSSSYELELMMLAICFPFDWKYFTSKKPTSKKGLTLFAQRPSRNFIRLTITDCTLNYTGIRCWDGTHWPWRLCDTEASGEFLSISHSVWLQGTWCGIMKII